MSTSRMDVDDAASPASVDDRTKKLFALVNRALGDPPETAAERLLTFLSAEPASLSKELRLLNARRVAKGVGAEAKRASSGVVRKVTR